ncbi:hypothetical protein THRCLA_09562 [Thraustotheca clavata]|uniref:Ricin B lectin domain-containing protein n=1 Tax=Thraustotheca clavata TaxID=74557 RepID=A0A1V9YVT6_9STRA|nr:hypothetical protein THRCLA_09562 [Thraustotheca clavata]
MATTNSTNFTETPEPAITLPIDIPTTTPTPTSNDTSNSTTLTPVITTPAPTTPEPTSVMPSTPEPSTPQPTTPETTTLQPTSPAPTSSDPGIDIQLCTFTQNILSEYYGRVYVDVIRNNDNEKITYTTSTKSIKFKSNGECLSAAAKGEKFVVDTRPCNSENTDQQWVLDNHQVRHAAHQNLCVTTSRQGRQGEAVSVDTCDNLLSQYIDKCTGATTKYVYFESCNTRRVVSEYYTGLYADDVLKRSISINELFEFNNGMIRAASNNQCLDAFRDGDKYGLHTYDCDASNNNQKWYFDNGRIKHAFHPNLCFDADPTDGSHKTQVWQCFPNNDNQCWNMISV